MRHGKVISYDSRQLKVHKRNYPTYDLVLAAVVFSLKIWRHNLYGFILMYLTTIRLSNLFLPRRSKISTKNVLKIIERLWDECHLLPRKVNVVVDVLSRMTIGSVSHIDEAKKHLVKDVHRLSRLAWVEDYPDCGFMVHNNSESSLVVEVKSKQHLEKSLMQLKESVLGKLNNTLFLGGVVF